LIQTLRFEKLPAKSDHLFSMVFPPPLKFRQGLYSYKSYWQGALPWLRERLDNPPSEKIQDRVGQRWFRRRFVVSARPVACAPIVGGAHWRAWIADYTS